MIRKVYIEDQFSQRKRVVVESPLKGKIPKFASSFLGCVFGLNKLFEYFGRRNNRKYAKACIKDCLKRGEAPYASHLLFDQSGLLNDMNEEERQLGMNCGFIWNEAAVLTAVYVDRGFSSGMKMGLENARKCNRKVEFRSLGRYNQEWLEFFQKAYEKPDLFVHQKDLEF